MNRRAFGQFRINLLKSTIQSLRNRKRTLVQHCSKKSYVRTLQLFFYAPDRLASTLIRFDDQHQSIGQLSEKGRLRLTAECWRAEEDVLKSFAQFGEALSETLHRRVEARLHQIRGYYPQIPPANRFSKVPNWTIRSKCIRQPNLIGCGELNMQLRRMKIRLHH